MIIMAFNNVTAYGIFQSMVLYTGQHCKFGTGIAICFSCHFLNRLRTFAADSFVWSFHLYIATGSVFQ